MTGRTRPCMHSPFSMLIFCSNRADSVDCIRCMLTNGFEMVCSGRTHTKCETLLFIYIYDRRGVFSTNKTTRHQTIEFPLFFRSRTLRSRRLPYRDFIVRQSAPNLMFSDSLIHFHRCAERGEGRRVRTSRTRVDNVKSGKELTNEIRRVEHYLITAQFLVFDAHRGSIWCRAKSKYWIWFQSKSYAMRLSRWHWFDVKQKCAPKRCRREKSRMCACAVGRGSSEHRITTNRMSCLMPMHTQYDGICSWCAISFVRFEPCTSPGRGKREKLQIMLFIIDRRRRITMTAR